ncbi:hypothetical protein [Aquirufa sp.]|jgi:hypothetical protein|uniref:hypothetical protein n=1 Tax=Aquirufa sp. TaxID=2676249 RepID=UPI0037C033C3
MSKKLQQQIFLIVFAIIAIALISPVHYTTTGLDAGWTEAILMVTERVRTFGQDFIFTYGPLGYLSFRILPLNTSIFPILFLDILSIAHLLFILKILFEKLGKFWYVAAISGLIIILPWGFFADLSFTYFFYYIFWILYSYYHSNSFGIWAALLISVLLFFVKVNISLIVIFIFIINSIYLVKSKKFTWKLILIQNILLVFGIIVLSKLLYVDLLNYTIYTLPLIDGYQDSMSTIIISKKELLILLVIEFVIFLIFCWQFFVMRKSLKSHIYLILLVTIFAFLGFKQAHTAISNPNIFGFFLLLPMINGLLFLYSDQKYKSKIGLGFICVLLVHLLATQYIRYSEGEHTIKGYFKTFHKINFNPIHYFEKLFDYQYTKNFEAKPLQFPERIKTKIGQQTVDILHNDVSYIFFNKLNYNPRPVIQTYSAYTAQLMQLNGRKYASASAPDFVLFKLEPFREQNPFWADTDVNFELLKRYTVNEQFTVGKDTLLLLQKNNATGRMENFVFRLPTIKQDQYIPLPQRSAPYRMVANLEYSVWGKLCRLLFQPPYMYCTIYYADGTQKEFRVIDKILKGGVIVNKRVTTQNELLTFYTHKGEKNTNVAGIKFHTRFSWAYL